VASLNRKVKQTEEQGEGLDRLDK